MIWKAVLSSLALGGIVVMIGTAPSPFAETAPFNTLRSPSSFLSIGDERARSQALFQEAGKVLHSPRCLNCHPATNRPTQTMSITPHDPPVFRGEGGMGLPGMPCTTCHADENRTVVGQADKIRSVPGHAMWHLAPSEMAWQGKTLREICEQVKDPARNGNRNLDQILEHMAHDKLVGWAWEPGAGREPAPGTQAQFGDLLKAWVDTGAICPTS